MGCVLCLDHAAGCANEDPEVDGSGISPPGRCGSAARLLRRATLAVSVRRKYSCCAFPPHGARFLRLLKASITVINRNRLGRHLMTHTHETNKPDFKNGFLI